MANKKLWLGMLVLVLTFGMTVVGCEEAKDDGPLVGTVWTRSASSNTGSGNGFQTTFTLSFVDNENATYNESGWTMYNNKKTTVNETSNYTYVYNTPSERKGALTPSEGTSGIGIIFEVSADGKTLTTTSANTAVGLTGGTWQLKSGSVSGSSTDTNSGSPNTGGNPVNTPITQIPDNYLNTTWRYAGDIYVRIGSDASKFVFDQVGNNVGKKTFENLSPITKDEIATGFDSGLYAKSYNSEGIICFTNDGSKLKWLGSTYIKQ